MADFEFDVLKGEKAIAMRKYKRMHYITKLFRFTEAFLFLFFLFPWFSSSRLPAAVRVSGYYLQRLLRVLASQKVVFVVGNAIIVTLLVKSGLLGGRRRLSAGDLYDELVRNIEHAQPSRTWERLEEYAAQASPRVPEADEGAVFEDKAVCVVERGQPPHSYRRSLSEKQRTRRNSCRELRRTETEKIWTDRTPPVPDFPYDEAYVSVLSNEEFQRTIDAFISKQIQFRRQESLSLVVKSQ